MTRIITLNADTSITPPNPPCCNGTRLDYLCPKCEALYLQTRNTGRNAPLRTPTINYKADLEARLASLGTLNDFGASATGKDHISQMVDEAEQRQEELARENARRLATIPDDAGDLLSPPTENERKAILPRTKMVYENPLDRQRRREAGLIIIRPKPKSEREDILPRTRMTYENPLTRFRK